MAKPKRVENAVFADDKERLSAMGRAGANATNEKKRAEREKRELMQDFDSVVAARAQEDAVAGARQMAEDRGDDLIPEDDQ